MASKDYGFLGCGGYMVAPYLANGDFTNQWYDAGEANKFELKENTTDKDRISKKCATYGALASSIPIKQPSELNIEVSSLNTDNFAQLFLGESVTETTVTGTFDELHVVKLGRFTRLSVPNVLTLIVTDSGAVTTYTEGTDYKILNAKIGMIEILPTGAITDGESVKFVGTMGTTVASRIDAGTKVGRRVRILFVGTNLDNNANVTVEVYDVVLTPQSGVDFLADDFVSGEMSGRPVIDATEQTAYTVRDSLTYSA